MKTVVGHNPRDSRDRDSVPEGRQDVATGESPWYAMMERRKSRRVDRDCDGVISCRPFRTENHLCFSNHGLTPVATTCRHIRGSNAGSVRPAMPFINPVFWREKSFTALPNGATLNLRTWSTFLTCSARWNRAPLISVPVLSFASTCQRISFSQVDGSCAIGKSPPMLSGNWPSSVSSTTM